MASFGEPASQRPDYIHS